MTAALLYFAVAILCLVLASRYILEISLWAAIVILLLPLCFTGSALLSGRVYAPIDLPYQAEPLMSVAPQYGIGRMHNPLLSDVYCLYIPWKKAVRAAYTGGELALWNPFSFAGDILAASGQPAPFGPPFLLSLLVPLANSLTFLAAITFFLAGLGMFVYLRDVGCGEEGALTASVGWMFGNFIVFWVPWVMTPTVLWLPMILLAVRRIITRGEHRDVALLTTVFTMMLLAGHPESALHLVSVGIAYALFELFVQRPSAIWKIAAKGTLAGVLALLLTAIYLLPMVEAIPQTMEHDHREAVYAKQDRNRPLSEVIAMLEMNLIPFLFGDPRTAMAKGAPINPTLDTSYGGSILLALAVYGSLRSRSRLRLMMLWLLAFGLLAGTDAPPLADLLARLPLFDIAINNRYIFVALFALSALAGLGVDEWLRRGGKSVTLVVSFGATFLLLAVLVWIKRPDMLTWGLPESFIRDGAVKLLAPLLVGVLMLLTLKANRGTYALILSLLLIQRTAEMGSFQPTISAEAFYPPFPGLNILRSGSAPPSRMIGLNYTFIPNTAAMYELEDARGYQAMTFRRYFETYPLWSFHQPVWFNRVDDLSKPFLSFLNVRHALALTGTAPPPYWRSVFEHKQYVILENERVLPRAFVPRKIRINVPADKVVAEMMDEQDFAERAWIEHPEGKQSMGELENGPGTVATTSIGTRRKILSVNLSNPGWVVVSEAHWKGWKAFVDGRRIPLRFANHAFIGMFLPAGKQTVELIYSPRSFKVGSAVSLLTLLSLGAYGAVRLRGRKRIIVQRNSSLNE